ncbi:hypothetical protein C1T20_19260 [Paenibacillus polymyxa]|nr:hypothetical protein C1T20_19260 [Paenibacillus polymyxa]
MDFEEAFQQTTPEGVHEYRNVMRNSLELVITWGEIHGSTKTCFDDISSCLYCGKLRSSKYFVC